MGATSFLSILLFLGLTASVAVSQELPTTYKSENVTTATIFITNLMYKDADEAQVKKVVTAIMSEMGGELATMKLLDGEPCTKVFVEWKNGNHDVLAELTRRVLMSGVQVDGQKYDIAYDSCKTKVPGHLMEIEFFIKEMKWMDDYLKKDSSAFMEIKNMVGEYFSPLQGEMKAFRLSENFGCVRVFMQYEATKPTSLFSIMRSLKDGLYIQSQMYQISTDACVPDIVDNKNQCPKPKKNYFTICNNTCGAEAPCEDGFKCCYNGCGNSCVRVGYATALEATVVVDMQWLYALKDHSGADFATVGSSLRNVIATQFGNMLHAVDVHRFDYFYNEDMKNATKAMVTLYFKEDFTNDEIYDKQMKIMKSVLPMGQVSYKIAGLKFGMEGRCGNVECHGLCKHLITGEAFCSCDQGRIGLECRIFDCRKDVIAPVPDLSQNYCRGRGQCVHNDDLEDKEKEGSEDPRSTPEKSPMGKPKQMYVCDCQAPYMGETCQYQVCDFYINPCNGHGTCIGNVDEGVFCKCNEGWGGLFCEKNVPDPVMTPCEKVKRLMYYVHRQVTGEEEMDDHLVIPMKMLLKKMGLHAYPVYYCLPSDAEVTPGSFYSVCYHNISSGGKEMCQCLEYDATPNKQFYFKKDDCRGFGGDPVLFIESIYIQDTPWSHEMSDMNGSLYMNIFQQVDNIVKFLQGGLKHITLMPRGANCVEMQVEMVLDKTTAAGLPAVVPSLKITINDTQKQVSLEPCKTEVNINSCPPTDKFNEVSICMYECNPKAQDDCSNGQTCCPLACGGGQCLELGFLQKVMINITVSIPYKPDLSDSSSAEYLIILGQLSDQLMTFLDGKDIPGYESFELVGMFNASDNDFMSNSLIPVIGQREKRQAEPDYTTISLVVKLNQEIDVEAMNTLRNEMLMTYLRIDGEAETVLSVTFGERGKCSHHRCHGSSICVDHYGGKTVCACPKGRSGPSCSQSSCFNEDGKSVCENGGTCERDLFSKSSMCSCPDGYGGETCQVNYCSFLKPDACNEGTCEFNPKHSKICNCTNGNKGGLFCELNTPDNLTVCERQSRMMNYLVDVIAKKEANSRLKVEISQFIKETRIVERMIKVPTCWGHSQGQYGGFKYICDHHVATGKRMGDCTCVSTSGRPNYYKWENGECIVHVKETACDHSPCLNNGTCVPLGNKDYYCRCRENYDGKNCEKDLHEMCPNSRPALKTALGSTRSCQGQACPFGFDCSRNMNNSLCCFDDSFLCKLEGLCQNGGTCIAGAAMTVCKCPNGKDGLFCEKDSDGVKLTECQMRLRYYSWVAELMEKRREMPKGITLSEMQMILKHVKLEYLTVDFCDDEGQFKSKARAINIFKPSESKEVCLDDYGNIDDSCHEQVCEMLDNAGLTICQNGGRCMGDMKRGLCDCEGTGHHGVLCEMPGKGPASTDCNNARMIAKFALRAMNGSVEIMPGVDVGGMIKQLLSMVYSDSIFMPECDRHGKYTNRGCAYMLNSTEHRVCYCANLMGDAMSQWNMTTHHEPPKHCPGDKNETDKCPKEFGPDCKMPDGWCSKDVPCAKGEKCYRPIPCNEDGCYTDMREQKCVPDEIELPCDPRPCPHNPREKCRPCGMRGGHCIHVKKSYGKYGKGDDNDSDEKDKYGKGDDNDSDEKDKYGKGDDNDSDEKDKYGKGSDDNDSEEKHKDSDDNDSDDDDSDSDDNDSDDDDSDEYDSDEYDSEEKYGYDEDDIEWIKKSLMGVKVKDDAHYICKCPKGWGGKNCEIREEVCSRIPADLCTHGCIGDIERGVLCRCPEGFSGFLCNKPVYSRCQAEKAFFDDVIAIVKGEMKDSKYNTAYYRRLVHHLTVEYTDGDDTIPVRHCSKDGLYDKLQCSFNVNQKIEVYCFCVDRHGEYVSSNVQPYINYPTCSGPADFRALSIQHCLSPGLCLNGGQCVYDLYNGKMCNCKDGFHGLFCQHPAPEPETEPVSFCNFLEDSFLTAQSIVRNQSSEWLGKVADMNVYFYHTWSMISTENRTIKGYEHERHMTGIKVECNDDGTFKPYICDRHLRTNEILGCYCTGFKGPIIGTYAPNPQSLKCDWSSLPCNEVEERCPKLHCEHGHRVDLHMCPTCECKRPCEGFPCHKDERCVVRRHHENCQNRMGCEKAVCVPKRKPGMCPGHETSVYGTIIGGGLLNRPTGMENQEKPNGQGSDKPSGPGSDKPSGEKPNKPSGEKPDKPAGETYDKPGMPNKEDGMTEHDPRNMEGMKCEIECTDDADCESDKKCCGLCGNKCVEPLEPKTCPDQSALLVQKLYLTLEIQKGLHLNMSRSLYMTIFHLSMMKDIWIPTCKGDQYNDAQCKYNISIWRDEGRKEATECFCVDRLGHRIKGSTARMEDDAYSCLAKPLWCPAPNPMQEGPHANYEDKCTVDRDCAKEDKCCVDGIKKMCTKPIDPMKTSSTLDMMMEGLCDLAPDACQAGSKCSGMWKSKGESCSCPPNRKGPFCGIAKLASDPEMTVCQKKRHALENFNKSIAEYREHMHMGMKKDDDKLEGILKVMDKLVKSWSDEEKEQKYEKMSMIYHKCNEEGEFYTMQCSLSMHTGKTEYCFCVNRQGKELLGTRKHVRDGKPYCGGKEPSCKVGTPLRDDDGKLTTCGRGKGCPGSGYMCVRGMYGDLQCCPTGYHTDVCMMPSDGGFECKENASSPVTRYAYNWFNKKCEAFQFRGCGGNKNHYMTMEDCKKRCVDKIHLGGCPANFNITKDSDCDKNTCEADSDCRNDMFKCCQSTCGKHCVPSVNPNPKEGMCPFGHSNKEKCMSNDDCMDGRYCHKAPGVESGVCCVRVEDVNLCHIKPLMAMGMKGEMDSQEKDDMKDKEDAYGMKEKDERMGMEGKPGYPDKENGKGDDMHGWKDDMKGDKNMERNDDKEDKDSDDNDSGEKKLLDQDEMMCKEKKERYFYNPHKHMCEKTHICKDIDFNSFRTMEECCGMCGSGTRCKAGKCPKVEAGIYMMCKNECREDFDCKGSSICCYNGCAMTCRMPMPDTEEKDKMSKCLMDRTEAKRAMSSVGTAGCAVSYVPSCDERTKMYSRHQCQMSLGVCWCVTDHGHYIPNTMTRGPAKCDGITDLVLEMADRNPQKMSSLEFEVCPDNKPVHCCKPALCMKRCPAHPEAVCRVNPCGGCKAEFFDAAGRQVNCEEGLSKCEKELKETATHVLEARITAYGNRKLDEMDEDDLMETEQYIDNIKESRLIRQNVPLKCQQLPSTGNCKGFAKRWFYDPETGGCSMFIWGMCGGNENRFRSPEDCFQACDREANPCTRTKCGQPNPKCTLIYSPDCYQHEELCIVQSKCTMDPDINKVKGIFVPRCYNSGYSWAQCHGHYCWCVNSDGEYNGGLTKSRDMTCIESGPDKMTEITVDKCPDGSDPRVKCLKACRGKVCPGHPKAVCKVDLCSDSCATNFVDEKTSSEVTCEEENCQVFRFDSDDKAGKCKSNVLCDGKGVKTCPRDVCENATQTLCPKNPCAVCMVDPCTCDPYFMDVTTRKRLSTKQCQYVTKGACHLKTCTMMVEMEGARRGGIEIKEIDMPECKKNGKFEPKQCSSSFDCHCVGEDGVKIGEVSANGKCSEIKETKKVETTLTFKNTDLATLRREGKLQKFKDGILKYFLEDLGILRENIKIGEPYDGSVKVDVEIIQGDEKSGDTTDLAVVSNKLKQDIDKGQIDIDLGDKVLTADPAASTLVAKEDDGSGNGDGSGGDGDKEKDDDDDDLSTRDYIIIGAACGAAGLGIIILFVYCCCCSKRKEPETIDDTFRHERQAKAPENIYDNPDMTFKNKGYMPEEDHYMKVRM